MTCLWGVGVIYILAARQSLCFYPCFTYLMKLHPGACLVNVSISLRDNTKVVNSVNPPGYAYVRYLTYLCRNLIHSSVKNEVKNVVEQIHGCCCWTQGGLDSRIFPLRATKVAVVCRHCHNFLNCIPGSGLCKIDQLCYMKPALCLHVHAQNMADALAWHRWASIACTHARAPC